MLINKEYRILKKMHYLSDQQGIMDRYLKESNGWALHLENTKQAIIQSAETKQKGYCAVLGSGWLLDVPIEYLSQNFKKVFLFDIIHPTQIKHKMQKLHNVELIELDITGGGINEFYRSVQIFKSSKQRKELSQFQFTGFHYTVPFDFVISVNILNQLDILLIDYIKEYNLYTEDELMELRKALQKKHIGTLPSGKTCLITDFEELIFDNNNNLEKSSPLVHVTLPKDKIIAEWQWQFDHHHYVPGKNVVFNVIAVNL